MDTGNVDIQSKFVNALRTQKTEIPLSGALPCPFGHHGRMFQSVEQLYDHAKTEHASHIANLKPSQAKEKLKLAALELRKTDQSTNATVGGGSAPDITSLSLESDKGRESSPPSKKRPAESEGHGRRGKAPSHVKVVDSDYDRSSIAHAVIPERTRRPDARLFDPKQTTPTGTASPQRSATSDWSREATKSGQFQASQPQSPSRPLPHRSAPKAQYPHRQPGLIELQRYDPRYPGLLLQPDSRPISQEQLASEVKSIYAGLTMVETKCIHVDRAQAAAAQDNSDPNHKLASDHWQALIALHRTLLHEHHDFFLASQHPSASPALRRLAAKYSMPARMWKHGIHSFLELLRRRLPDSIDYMLAFIYLAYQMMALLYETVPAFEDTWIECLGDLGRYRMAIEDEDIRDRETWAGVARSWYTKAADKNPTVGRLYHHLAILARPNALQQLYYYSRSLTCVKPFPSARESILTLLDPILGRAVATYSHALPIDTNYIKAHAILFERLSLDDFNQAKVEFTNNLDNHVGRVTAKWKEQGVYIAVTNVSGWFDYGIDDNALRQVFLTQICEKAKNSPPPEEQLRTASPADQQDPTPPIISEDELLPKVNTLASQPHFAHAKLLTNDTFALILRRIGDKNVLPHVHIMLSFLTTFAASSYVSHLLADTPWTELVAFLNTLIKTESQIQNQSQSQNVAQPQNIDTLFSTPVFPNDGERSDELPLPEDYLVRGLVWAHDYFPKKWFEREHDEEERYLELASTVKSRMERVLRLGHKLAMSNRWISYDSESHNFSVLPNTSGNA
ncbi:hypothetical protein FB567DRAFT_608774 [Paraphoma chrysanthemicola]|uniref:DNA/RNA-binding domain-containing protein n=1 Tax=Paraphoma chrysanthemicola TaxID=798071 RepID=A0A8K0QW67_9PLEO|nr:hypothetical protein FB567DRAFT_608774 [Paraphoma chrysanthemicola]